MSQYTEILKKHKNEKQALAIVTGKTSKSYLTDKNAIITCIIVTLYDPKLTKEFKVEESIFGNDIMHTCSIGDIVKYVPQEGNWCAYISENISHEQRMKVFKTSYNNVYGNSK